MNETQQRRRAIIELVRDGAIGSQEELVLLLKQDHAIDVTQPTVSRDLDILGVRRIGRFYRAPEPGGLAQRLHEFAVAIESSGNLAVVKTPPGVAGAVASAIDAAGLRDVLATVQGDDTVLIVAHDGVTGSTVADQLRSLKESFNDR